MNPLLSVDERNRPSYDERADVFKRESRGITRGWSSDHPIVGTKQLGTLLVGKQQTYLVDPTIGGARSGGDGGPTLSVLIV